MRCHRCSQITNYFSSLIITKHNGLMFRTKNSIFTFFLGIYETFLQSHAPITETFRSCLKMYLYNMFQPSTGFTSGTENFYIFTFFNILTVISGCCNQGCDCRDLLCCSFHDTRTRIQAEMEAKKNFRFWLIHNSF